ncbi:transcriptional activator [Deinococcus roseus]|uniref:Transcriptional activator n=1 Tax=Deinococcus roseus TaxID=392414 RepID=A0ABQ2CXD0_9DEIO|nr:transcriptional activator [Deinococcus roseus]
MGQQSQALPNERSLWLLTYLAAQEDWVMREELAHVLWPDAEGSVARTRLRQLILRIKDQGLAPQMEVENHRLRWTEGSDLHLFRLAYSRRNWQEAHQIHHGLLLMGCATEASDEFTAWLDLERFKLQSQWRTAAHQHALKLQQQDPQKAEEVLKDILEQDGLAEDVLCDYLRVACRNDHQDAAAERYLKFVRDLEQQLQMQPRTETQQLFARLRAEKFPAVFPVVASGEHPGERAVPSMQQTSSLLGRQQELQVILKQLADPGIQILTLTGVGGAGKTRLALEVARQTQMQGCFLSLVGHPADQPILQKLAQELGLSASPMPLLEDQLRQTLGHQSRLLILDNVEQILPQAREFVRWLHDLPAVKVLLTSRICLGVMGEHVHALGGLQAAETLDALSPALSPALQLLLEASNRVQRPTDWTAEDWEAAGQICQRVEGLPLGLELAGAWRRLLGWTEIRDELDKSLDFLTGALPGLPERHSGMRIVFEHSWRLLPENLQHALSKLMVFRGSFERVSALQITGISNRDLLSLVDHSLVRRVRGSDQRFEVHELIREYVAEKQQAFPEVVQQIRESHARYFAAYVHQHDPYAFGANQQLVLQKLTQEQDNLHIACQHLFDLQDIKTLLPLFTPLCLLWVTRNMTLQAFEWLSKVRKLPGVQRQPEHYAELLLNQGNLARFLGQFAEAEQHYLDSLQYAEQHEVFHTACAARNSLGAMYLIQGRIPEAQNFFQNNLAVMSRMPAACKHQQSFSHLGMGHVFRIAGDFEQAGQCFQHSLHLIQQQGTHHFIAYVFEGLSILATDLGKHEEAYLWMSRCIEAKNRLDNTFEMAVSHYDLACIARSQGHLEKATRHFVQSFKLAVNWNQLQSVPATLEHLAELTAHFQQTRMALQLWGAAQTLSRKIQLPFSRPIPQRSIPLYQQSRAAVGEFEAHRLETEGSCLSLHQWVALLEGWVLEDHAGAGFEEGITSLKESKSGLVLSDRVFL